MGAAQRAGAEVRLGVSRAGRAQLPPAGTPGSTKESFALCVPGPPLFPCGGGVAGGAATTQEQGKGMSWEARGARGRGILSPFPTGDSRGMADGNGTSDRCQ